jgi:hypothetical protein
LVLDLTRPAVSDYLFERLAALVAADSAESGGLKVDADSERDERETMGGGLSPPPPRGKAGGKGAGGMGVTEPEGALRRARM